MQRRLVCQKCIYYFVTWEPNQPHGCKSYGFKSKQIPSVVVKSSSKEECKLFVEKNLNK